MSGSQNFQSPNFLIPYQCPDNVPPQIKPYISPIYTMMQNLVQTLINSGGIAPRSPAAILSSFNDPTSIVSNNVHRFYTEATETIAQGAAINLHAVGGILYVQNANATDLTKPADGFCSQVGGLVTGQIGEVILGDGVTSVGQILVPGTRYYLDVNNGQYIPAPPTALGNLIQGVGLALTSSVLWFFLNEVPITIAGISVAGQWGNAGGNILQLSVSGLSSYTLNATEAKATALVIVPPIIALLTITVPANWIGIIQNLATGSGVPFNGGTLVTGSYVSISGNTLTRAAGATGSVSTTWNTGATGLLYWEATATNIVLDAGVGGATSPGSFNNYLGSASTSFSFLASGHIYLGGVGIANLNSYPTGTVVGMAINLYTNHLWVTTDNGITWNANGAGAYPGANPSTGVSGISLAGLTGSTSIYPGLTVAGGSDSMTLNPFGPFAIPSVPTNYNTQGILLQNGGTGSTAIAGSGSNSFISNGSYGVLPVK